MENESVEVKIGDLNEYIWINDPQTDLITYFPEDLGGLDLEAKTIVGINTGDAR